MIEVNSTLAKKWRFASPEKREMISKTVEQMIDQASLQNDEDYWRFLDRLGKEAAANGLTEDKLQEILNER